MTPQGPVIIPDTTGSMLIAFYEDDEGIEGFPILAWRIEPPDVDRQGFMPVPIILADDLPADVWCVQTPRRGGEHIWVFNVTGGFPSTFDTWEEAERYGRQVWASRQPKERVTR
jgi:hypothetical protein